MKLIEFIKTHKKFNIIVFFVSLLFISSLVIYAFDVNKNNLELVNSETLRINENYKNSLNVYVNKLNIIETFYKTVGSDNINDTNFLEFGESINLDDIAFVSFSIAPDGIISYYFSYDYDDSLIGYDLVNDDRDEIRESIEYAIENNVIIVNGPFDLIQGNHGIVFRKPVFIDGEFSAIINFVVDQEQLNAIFSLSNSHVVEIGVYDNNNNLIFGNLEYSDDIFYINELDLEYIDWNIGITPSDEYINASLRVVIIIMSIALILYITALYISYNLYLKTKTLIKEKDILVNYDTLTELPNRRLLEKRVKELINHNKIFYLGFGDLDNFKNLNDVLGHSIGDAYLKDISDRFKDINKTELEVYRWGGDEFIFIIHKRNKRDVNKIINKLYSIFNKPIIINNTEFKVSMSIGLVRYPDNGKTIDDLIKRADVVMYDIKGQQRNSFGFFEDKYLDEFKRKVDFENQLSKYSLNDFTIYLQPVVYTDTQDIYGFEGLIRLFDEENHIINTQELVRFYERNGEISLIDKFTFEKLCNLYVEFKKLYNKEFTFSFNISPLTLSDDFLSFIKIMIKRYNLNPNMFIIEIIETLGFKDFDESLRLLNELRYLGFKVAMDDFGIGYSSLSYITKLPLNMIKIDRTFIKNYKDNEFDRLLILAIKQISKSLNIEILVEGIETEDQLKFIKGIDAQYFQGYIHSYPMSTKDLIEFLNNKYKG